ncbi:MAG: EAL domain-containing protein, partial [Leptonema sp. (in: Bacteria)]|nr:EAL domain-containing protein [Leptonema sp. (in: bacteria)]
RLELSEFKPHIVLCDYALPKFDGDLALSILLEHSPTVPFCFLSGKMGEQLAVESIKNGATDYVLKQELSRLPWVIERALKEAEAKKEKLRLEEDLMLRSAALEAAANAVYITDRNGRVKWVNRAFTQLTGISFEEINNRKTSVLSSGIQTRLEYRQFRRTIMSKQVWQGERLHKRRDGSLYSVDLTVTPVLDHSGEVSHFILVMQDITERKAQETRITRLNRVYRLLSRINALIIRVTNRQELYDGVCTIGVESGGFDIAIIDAFDVATSDVYPVSSEGVNSDHVALIRDARLGFVDPDGGLISHAILDKTTVYSNDITLDDVSESPRRKISKDLGYRSIVVLPLLLDNDIVGTLSLMSFEPNFFDSSELKLLQSLTADIAFALSHLEKSSKAEFLAFYNPVTELPNRRLFLERLHSKLRDTNGRCALALIDIERFRNINLTLGRDAGDSLLVQVAERLAKIRSEQILVAHIERDHFIVAFDDSQDLSEIAYFIEAVLIMIFAEPFQVNGETLRVSSRVGIAVFPDDASDSEDLLRNADQALLRSKAHKQLYSFYSPEMNLRVSESMRIENDLRVAITEDQFELYYQPKYDLRTAQIVGMEALIRWNHPTRGLMYPGQFLPVLEDTAMIILVGEWVIQTALKQYSSWKNQGILAPRIAVNVSAQQLNRENFIPSLKEMLNQHSDDGSALEIELTETIVMANAEKNIPKLKQLQDLGMTIAIDDFGTGYSSLNYMTSLPIDTLKIDRSFVQNMIERQSDRLIVSTIISLAHQLNLLIVAEGVETEEQADNLRLMGCDIGQGFLYSKAISTEQMTQLLPARG